MPLIAFFSVILLVQLAYLGLLHLGFHRAHRTYCRLRDAAVAEVPPMSIIVAARNEAERLPALLEALTRQTHPDYEIVIVDDASDDDSHRIIRSWQARDARIRLVKVEEPLEPRKKRALALGIEAASHELLALTDADCTPPPSWLEGAARILANDSGNLLLVGYSPFRSSAGLLNRFSRYETLLTGQLTAAAIGLARPYMAVGRSMFYSKALFHRTGGFSATLKSLSGDDDLFVQQVHARRTGRVVQLFGAESYVPTYAPATLRQWIRQKIRHTSAGRFYPRWAQLHLTIFHATTILLWIAPMLVGWWGAALLLVRLIVHGTSVGVAARRFDERSLMPWYPVLELLYGAYNVFIAPLGLIRMPSRW